MSKKLIKKNNYGQGSQYYEYIEQGLTPEQIDYMLSQEQPSAVTHKVQPLLTWNEYYKNVAQAKQERKDYMHNKGYDQFVYIDDPDKTYSDIQQDELITTYENPYVLEQIDSRFNNMYDSGKLKLKQTPDASIYGTPHIHLRIYPIGGKYLPGHIMAIVPTSNGTRIIDRKSNSPNYSLLGTHNCASSVYALLKDIFGNDFDPSTSAGGIWRPIDLPWNVERLAKQIPGSKSENKKDYREVIIPISDKYLTGLKNIKSRKYYESL